MTPLSTKQVAMLGGFASCVVISVALIVTFADRPPEGLDRPNQPQRRSSSSAAVQAPAMLEIADLSSATVEKVHDGYYTLKGNGLTIHGTVGTDVKKIVAVDVAGDEEHTLTRFTPGDETWEYNVRLNLGNMRRGANEYEIRAFVDENGKPEIARVTIMADVYENVVGEDVGHIEVAWREPAKVSTREFFKDYELRKGGIDLIMQYEPMFAESMSGWTLAQRMERTFVIHEIGYVSSGHYEGSMVYHIKVVQDGMCGGDPSDYHRVIRAPDGALTLLEKYSDGMDSRLYELVPFAVDKNVTMNLLPPDEIRIPNSTLTLRKKDSFNNFADFKEIETKTVFNDRQAGVTVLRNQGCFVVKHPDTTSSTYLLDLPTRGAVTAAQKEEQERMGKMVRVGEGILDITWKDGRPNTTQFVSRDYFSGFGAGCAYTMVGVRDGRLLPEGVFKGAPLEEIGATSWGEPVFREVYTKAELAAFVPEDDNYEENRRLFQAYDRYYSEEKPTMQEFYDQNHVIYIQDPFGNYMQFVDINVVPGAEMCKPVVYLYPEESMDVSVSVAPKGGFSLTIPEYNDGWNVHATPDSVITDRADGKEYPYLFWEGFTAPGYLMHDEGFVVSREQIPCALPALLQAQGLRGKEITDFMEYWAPILTKKPYYFLTFMPQPLFELEAPMSVEPTPDTVIRVFMDYQGLDQPIQVKPQIFTPPERRGFTVIEWGGAKH